MRLQQAIEIFLAEYKESTRLAYGSVLHPLVEEFGARRRVRDIATMDLIQYAQDLKASDRAEATIHKHIKTIKVFFNWLVKCGELDKDQNPSRAVRQIPVKHHVRQNKVITEAELKRLLDVVFGDPLKYAIVSFIADTGCRVGGAAGLLRVHLDLENMSAIVTEKGDEVRPVFFGRAATVALEEWLAVRPEVEHDFVFCHSRGEYTPAAISQMWRRACIRAGLRSLGPHSARHLFGHRMANNGVPISIVQKALGHKNMDITRMYFPDSIEEVKTAVQSLSRKEDHYSYNPDVPDNILRFKKAD